MSYCSNADNKFNVMSHCTDNLRRFLLSIDLTLDPIQVRCHSNETRITARVPARYTYNTEK